MSVRCRHQLSCGVRQCGLLTADGDVDYSDVNLFLSCMAGSGHVPGVKVIQVMATIGGRIWNGN
jgi:hypothetical protein